MKYFNFLEAVEETGPIMDGKLTYDFGNGLIVCLVAILMVFLVLLIIIGFSSIVSSVINKFVKTENKCENEKPIDNNSLVVDINDEDMVAAILVASIDYRNEIKKDVKLINIREVK